MKRFIRRWLGLPDPHGVCSVQAELVAISVEIGALKDALVSLGCSESTLSEALALRQRLAAVEVSPQALPLSQSASSQSPVAGSV